MSPRQFFILVISAVSLHQGSSYFRDPNLTDDVSKGKGGSLHSHIFKESIPARSSRTDLVNRSPLRDDHSHELVFVIRQNNMNLLARILNDISDPSNPSYGQHLSAEQISAITTNPDARNAIVAFLHTSGATISSESRSGDSINAIAPISIWENVLDTKFYNFHQRQRNGNIAQFVRAESYSIPRELDMHLAAVLRTVDIPVVRPGASIFPEEEAKHVGKVNGHLLALYDGITTAQNLRSYYSIGDATGSSASTQAAVAFSDNYFSPRSLAYFQRNMSFQPLQPALNFGGYLSEDPSKFYLESNLDIEFIMAISPVSPTTVWHVAAGFETMMSELVSSNNPPYVISISYGTDESTYPANAHDFVTTLAIKLSAMGRTLVVASGDEGASSWKKCGYNPSFPASNPYFTAVGGTAVSAVTHCALVARIFLTLCCVIASRNRDKSTDYQRWCVRHPKTEFHPEVASRHSTLDPPGRTHPFVTTSKKWHNQGRHLSLATPSVVEDIRIYLWLRGSTKYVYRTPKTFLVKRRLSLAHQLHVPLWLE